MPKQRSCNANTDDVAPQGDVWLARFANARHWGALLKLIAAFDVPMVVLRWESSGLHVNLINGGSSAFVAVRLAPEWFAAFQCASPLAIEVDVKALREAHYGSDRAVPLTLRVCGDDRTLLRISSVIARVAAHYTIRGGFPTDDDWRIADFSTTAPCGVLTLHPAHFREIVDCIVGAGDVLSMRSTPLTLQLSAHTATTTARTLQVVIPLTVASPADGEVQVPQYRFGEATHMRFAAMLLMLCNAILPLSKKVVATLMADSMTCPSPIIYT